MELKIKYPGIPDELIAKIMADDNPQRVAEVMATIDEAFAMMDKGMSPEEIIKTFVETPRSKNAGGGLNYLMGM
jgi:predicted transglutaminase-like protease